MHIPVLLHEAIDGLAIKEGDVYVDATIGGAGHALLVAERFGRKVEIVGIDADEEAVKRSSGALERTGAKFKVVRGNFRRITEILETLGKKEVNRILFDLGTSRFQIFESGRGFSFIKDEPLRMTFGRAKRNEINAEEIVNKWDEENLREIISSYGEERFGRKIAKKIAFSRKERPIKSTGELVEIIKKAVPARYQRGKIHFATKTFQSLRIAVNDEIGALRGGLSNGWRMLAKGGRMAFISFHSLEDRIVKRFGKEKKDIGEALIITKKPIVPGQKEIEENPASRSAKLRIFQKI